MKKLRKIFTASIMAITVLSMSLVVAPQADAAQAGDLVKIEGNSAVFYLSDSGKRHVFPNEATYFSWYSDFSGITTISQSELDQFARGANVTVRPGTQLITSPDTADVYAVEYGGVLRSIVSEENAINLYGADWAQNVVDIVPSFMSNYTTGSPLTPGTYPAGTLVKAVDSPDVYLIDENGDARIFADGAAFLANNFKWDDIVETTMTIPAAGDPIDGAEADLVDVSQGGGGTGVIIDPNVGSGLSATLSSQTPASVSVPKNGARVPMLTVNLTAANDGDVTVDSLLVKRIGLSTYSQMKSVWAEKDGTVVASKKSINSNNEATLVFSPALTISAGTTVSLELLASLDAATGNIGLGVISASAITTNGATVSGSFPINGNLMAPIDYDVANLSFTSVNNTYTPKVGDENVELGRFTVDFNSYAKDVALQSVMLKNNGAEDLAKTAMNLYLEYNGDKVTNGVTVDGRYVTLNFIPEFDHLKDDPSKILYLRGDVIAKENTSTDSYVIVLNKSTDFVAYEKSTGFGVNVYNATSGTTVADNVSVSTVQIQAGVITVSKKATSPSDTTVVKGSDNVVLLANVRADEAINADGLNIVYGSDASTATTTDQFENVRVYVNGLLVDSFDPEKDIAALKSKALDSSVSLNQGDNEIKVMARAKTTAPAASAFYAKLDNTIFNSQNAEYASTGNMVDTVADVSGTATGGTFTVQGAVLTTVRNDGFAAGKTVVKGGNDIMVGRFAVKATYDDIRVTSVSLSANASTTPASSLNSAELWVNGEKKGSTQNFGTSGATFSSLDFIIDKDTTDVFELMLSFDSAATGGFQTTMTINAQDSRGTAIAAGNTADTTNFQVIDSGELVVDLGGNTPEDGLLAAISDQQEIAQFKFTAIDDSATISEINVTNTSSSTASEATSTADSIVSGIYLYDGTEYITDGLFVAGQAKFMVNDRIVVPANENKVLTVKATFNPIVNNADATNKDIRLVLDDVKFKSSAGTVTTQTETEIANAFRVRKTVPIVTTESLPETLLTAGDKVVSKFKVTANNSGDVSLKKVVLTYATTTNSSLAGLANNAVKVNGSTKSIASVLDAGAKTLTITFATPEVISAGQSKTFEILGTVAVSGSGSESVTTKISEDASYATDGSGSFVWSDGASISNYTYLNGHNVSGLPTTTQTLSK